MVSRPISPLVQTWYVNRACPRCGTLIDLLQSPEQMLVVVQVQARTNLVTPMAIDCAQTAGFNLETALAKFQELQVSFTRQVSCCC